MSTDRHRRQKYRCRKFRYRVLKATVFACHRLCAWSLGRAAPRRDAPMSRAPRVSVDVARISARSANPLEPDAPIGFPLGAVCERNHLLGNLRGQDSSKDVLSVSLASFSHDRQGICAAIVHLLDLLDISVLIFFFHYRGCSVENLDSAWVPTLICAEGATGLLKSLHAVHD